MVRQTTDSFPRKADSSPAYEDTLKRALAEREQVAHEREAIEGHVNDLEMRHADLTALVKSLLPLLPADKRAIYAKKLATPVVSGRASEAHSNVIQILAVHNAKREWTALDVQTALRQVGIESDIKPIHNTLNYLAREGRIRRISRGRYYVPEYGVGIVTSDPLTEEDTGIL